MNERLLYIGADKNNRAIVSYLKANGYEIVQTVGLRPSLRMLTDHAFDAVIIDLGDVSIINARRISRKAGRRPEKPFCLVINEHRSQVLESLLFDAKITRPFTASNLEAVLRKYFDKRQKLVVVLGPLTLDRRTHVVRSPKGTTRLTQKQYQLLNFFFKHPNELISRRELMKAVWETDYLGDTRTLDVHMRWLREIIEQDPSHPEFLVTERGKGYCLRIDKAPRVGAEPLIAD